MRVMVLTDRKRIVISETEELGVQAALNDSKERVTVQGVPYKKSMIAYFDDPTTEERSSHTPIQDPFVEDRQLPSGPKCRAQYSIQMEINNIAKDEGGPKGWGKLIRNKKWREETRKALLASSDQWCDYKTGACACEPNFTPSHRSFSISS